MRLRWITLLLTLAAGASAVVAVGPFGVALTAILLVVMFRARNTKTFGTMATDMVLTLFVGLLFIGVPWLFVRLVLSKDPEGFNRNFCRDHLHQIMLALHGYHQAHGCFPPAYVADKTGRPMHSWRVLILPYMDCKSLYKQYDFNEPWNGPNNRKLLAKRPRAYVCPSDKTSAAPDAVSTNFVAVVGPNSAWSGEKPRKAADIAPMSRTVMLVEVAGANIPWTEPRDLGDCPNCRASENGTVPLGSPTSQNPLTVSSDHLPSGYFFRIPRAKVHIELADGTVPFVPQELFDGPDSAALLKIGGFPEEYIDKEWPPSQGQIDWPTSISFAVCLASVALLLFRAVHSRKQLAATLAQGRAGDAVSDLVTEYLEKKRVKQSRKHK